MVSPCSASGRKTSVITDNRNAVTGTEIDAGDDGPSFWGPTGCDRSGRPADTARGLQGKFGLVVGSISRFAPIPRRQSEYPSGLIRPHYVCSEPRREKETPVGGNARVSEADDHRFGGYLIVLMNRTATRDRQFRHVPNQNDLSPRLSDRRSGRRSAMPTRPGSKGIARRESRSTGLVLKKAALEQSASDAAKRCSFRGPESGRLRNQAHLDK
jgi:hypothetical protein